MGLATVRAPVSECILYISLLVGERVLGKFVTLFGYRGSKDYFVKRIKYQLPKAGALV